MGHRAWLLASMRNAHVCGGQVARQWTPEHEIYDPGKVFPRREVHVQSTTCTRTQSPTHLYTCVGDGPPVSFCDNRNLFASVCIKHVVF